MAPEVIDGKQDFTNHVDMWACGIIMHEILSGKHPIHHQEDTSTTFKAKIKSLTKLYPDPSLSWIAKNLF